MNKIDSDNGIENEELDSETSSHDSHKNSALANQDDYSHGEFQDDEEAGCDEEPENAQPCDDMAGSQRGHETPSQIDDGHWDDINDIDALLNTDGVKHEQLDTSDNHDPNIWTLPANKDTCTLEEIRRGQVINKTGANECPVPGCGKKINEARIDPSPGTIASGLRTHVLFVHYANRKVVKKRKLGWSAKRKNQPSPKKHLGSLLSHSSPSTSRLYDHENSSIANLSSSLNLIHKGFSPSKSPILPHPPGSLLNKKVKQITAAKSQMQRMSSLQSLMQMTANGPKSIGQKSSNKSQQDTQNLNPTTSSLFSILAGLTQQQNINQAQNVYSPKDLKTANGTNTINLSPCPRNMSNNSDRPVNSSLLSLLNEKLSSDVNGSLQNKISKSTNSESRAKLSTVTSQNQGTASVKPQYSYQTSNNDSSFNNGSSILSSLCTGNVSASLSYNSSPLSSFIESIANKTGSNIGPAGIAEAKRIIEKFTTSLICSSQTIADHYIAPFAGEVPQQKPEISASDLVLAYKMMHKSHGQP